jgi:hypothetical protein
MTASFTLSPEHVNLQQHLSANLLSSLSFSPFHYLILCSVSEPVSLLVGYWSMINLCHPNRDSSLNPHPSHACTVGLPNLLANH